LAAQVDPINSTVAPATSPMVTLDRVTREHRTAGLAPVRAIDQVSLQIARGEWIAIMGPSGSGKSTLVNLIGCLDHATSGSVVVNGVNTQQMNGSELDRFRSETIGFVFQQFHLIPYLTALENVMLAQYFHSMTDATEAQAALTRVGLAGRAQHLPSQLSGGEQQRVCIARALINQPPILLADEPTGNLDEANQRIVLSLLRQLHSQGHTLVMVTHDPEIAKYANRIVRLQYGRIATQQLLKVLG
jgi:putative ABC transport system ATP-binding protein